MCRGESSCILPLAPAAMHTNPAGSRLAIRHFTEYLERYPDDLEVRWLLNLAHMTLGEHPAKVDPRYLVALDRFHDSEFDIGRFRDIGQTAGVNRFNQAGGAIFEDFDNDGRLDLVVSSFDPTEPLAFYRNKGDGTFEDRRRGSRRSRSTGGKICVQTDYNNDGRMDLFIARGPGCRSRPAELAAQRRRRPFTDVTAQAGLLDPVNSNSARGPTTTTTAGSTCSSAASYSPIGCTATAATARSKRSPRRAGVGRHTDACCKGATWIDYDNDDYPDLFVNYLSGPRGSTTTTATGHSPT